MHVAAQFALHRRHPRQAACGSGWAEEGRRYRRAQRLRPTALVEVGGMAERGRLEALDVGRHPCHDCGRGFIWRARKYETSQLHRFKHAPGVTALRPVADVSLRRSEPPLRADFVAKVATLLNNDSVALMRFAVEAIDDGAAQSRPR